MIGETQLGRGRPGRRGQRTEDISSLSSSYIQLKIVLQVLVSESCECPGSEQEISVTVWRSRSADDQRGAPSQLGLCLRVRDLKVQHPLRQDGRHNSKCVSESAHLTFSPAPEGQVAALMLCEINQFWTICSATHCSSPQCSLEIKLQSSG